MSKAQRDKAGRFLPGQSGNAAGRKPGEGPNRSLREQINAELPGILDTLVKQAQQGDVQAAALLVNKVIPNMRPEARPVVIPHREGLADRATAILDAAASGNLPPDVASQLVTAVGTLAKVVEVDEIEQRLTKLEAQHEQGH